MGRSRTMRPYEGRTVVVQIDGDPLRGVLSATTEDALVLTGVTQADGTPVDGLLVVPWPTVVQVV